MAQQRKNMRKARAERKGNPRSAVRKVVRGCGATTPPFVRTMLGLLHGKPLMLFVDTRELMNVLDEFSSTLQRTWSDGEVLAIVGGARLQGRKVAPLGNWFDGMPSKAGGGGEKNEEGEAGVEGEDGAEGGEGCKMVTVLEPKLFQETITPEAYKTMKRFVNRMLFELSKNSNGCMVVKSQCCVRGTAIAPYMLSSDKREQAAALVQALRTRAARLPRATCVPPGCTTKPPATVAAVVGPGAVAQLVAVGE
jgi:hypothetical protein